MMLHVSFLVLHLSENMAIRCFPICILSLCFHRTWLYLLRTKPVVSPPKGTSDRRMYGASTVRIRLKYDRATVNLRKKFYLKSEIKSLKVTGLQSLCLGVCPYDEENLEKDRHAYELPGRDYVNIGLNIFMA